ncbi:hypothetical protein CW731_01060 [Polaribacter sp. ALD11]|uniref:T9SS type B sorting domain-containing protein n=1 Tax=Polaribacter sp. ALD11 TaxID=2058137 RepID=UPI000C308F3F|nr:T9SS type B sorting domain-containing protein [Polaribacter sp. ALD11]AUC83964.1 hypothetical protein CW731_01060 [Polaribacter sp. ALD11]
MKNILTLFLLFIALNTFSQKEANFWYFGENAGLDFTSFPPKAIRGALSTDEGSASISNSEGVLQFYTDGQTVYSNTGTIMSNGRGLLGNSSSTQSAIIVPKPLNNNIYYIFTVTDGNNIDGVNYSTVDISRNDGLGEVTDKNIYLPTAINAIANEKITAVKGKLCNTFWVVTSDSNKFYAYLIDSNGVNRTAVISDHSFISNLRGALKVSPDGKTLVSASQGDGATYLYDFDPATGEISNEKNLDIHGLSSYGVGFSRSSKKLYISTGAHSQLNNRTGLINAPSNASIVQYDLSSSDITAINASSKEIYRTSTGYRGALQLASDGKIYYARSRQSFLGIINFPEKDGSAINFVEDGLPLNGQNSTEGLPPFIQSFFLDVGIKDEDTDEVVNFENLQVCIGESKTIIPETITGTNLNYTWTFDNGTTKVELPSSAPAYKLELTNLQTTNSGSYSLVITLEDSCTNTIEYNATFNLTVNTLPQVNSIDTYNQCDFDSVSTDGITSFNLESKETELSEGATDVNVDFFEPGDTNYTTPIINKVGYRNPSINPFNHKLLVKVTNNITGCYSTGEIDLKITATSLDTYTDIYESELDENINSLNARNSKGSGDTIFNFDAKIDDITLKNSSFNKTDFQFYFYLNKLDAEKEINKIETYTQNNFTDSTVIYVRISKGNTCAGVGKFNFYVNERPTPKGNTTPIILCVSNPIDSPQPFTENLDADTGVPTDSYIWYLNGSLLSGETNAILEANKEGTYRVEASRGYENDTSITTDNSFTTGYNTFTVLESNEALLEPESITFIDDQENPTDNTITVKVTGKGDYEYALNDDSLTNFVKGSENLSYTFKNVPAGLNKVFIRDRNNCGRIINTKKVSFLFFQRHFSPNEDGVLDKWKILGVDNTFYNEVKLQVFDRFGKILKNIDLKTNDGWNGTYNGKLLPSNDYWYSATLIDLNGNVRKKTGHFSLIRK